MSSSRTISEAASSLHANRRSVQPSALASGQTHVLATHSPLLTDSSRDELSKMRRNFIIVYDP